MSSSAPLPPQVAETLHHILEVYPGITGTKYLSAIGLTALLWDHLLTLSEEIDVIWCRPCTLSKFTFVFLRYGVLAALLLIAYVTSGLEPPLDDTFCRRWVVFAGLFAVTTMCVAGFVLIKRVYTLYDHRKRVLHALVAGFALSVCGIAVFAGLSLRQILRTMHYEPNVFHTCIVTEKPHLLSGLWGSQVVFDIYVFILTLWNAAERPRRVETELVTQLNRDGIYFFFIVFLLRLLNLVLSLVSEVSLTFLAPFFVWAMIIVTLSRLTLQLEHMRLSVGELAVSMELLSTANTSNGTYGFGGYGDAQGGGEQQRGHEHDKTRCRKSLACGKTSEQANNKRSFGGRQTSDLSQEQMGCGVAGSVDHSSTRSSYMWRW